MDSSSISHTSADVSVSLADLKTRLHALQEDKAHYMELATKANHAFETHRVELTQLRQKEHAVFSANEDRLRTELQDILTANRVLMEQLSTKRQTREAELKEELLALRRGSTDQLSALQEELDELWRQRRGVDIEVLHAASEKAKAEADLQQVLRTQQDLHNTLQQVKQVAMEELESAAAATSALESSSATSMGQVCGCGCACHQRTRASPIRWPRAFIPSGPKGRYSEDRGEAAPATSSHGRSCCSHGACPWAATHSRSQPCAVLSRSPPHRTRGARARRSLCTATTPVLPMDRTQPATHNAQAILSTIERNNFLRPRDSPRRGCRTPSPGHREVYGTVDALASGDGAEAPPSLEERLCGMRRQHLARREAERAMSPVMGAGPSASTREPSPTAHGWFSSPPAPCGADAQGRHQLSPATSSLSPPHTQRTPPPPPVTGPSSSSAPSQPLSPPFTASVRGGQRSPYFSTRSGRAMNAACDAILAELQGLRDDYAECQRRLRDPHADSVEASRDMRRTLAAMDRKADQLRTMRAEQHTKAERLHTKDVLKEVMRENSYCEGIYRDIVDLVRS